MNKIFFIVILLFFVYIGLSFEQNQQKGDENCETMPSEIHLIKEEYDELGRLQRTCNGEVFVNKCEGLCNSQVQPSVITPTGFLKVFFFFIFSFKFSKKKLNIFFKGVLLLS